MKLVRTHKFRLYPTQEQERRLLAWQDALRFLWNLANEQHLLGLSRPQGERRYPTAFDQARELTELRAQLPWLADVPRTCSEAILQRLEAAWKHCYRKEARKPRWKRKGIDCVSLHEAHPGRWRIEDAHLSFPRIGRIPMTAHRLPQGNGRVCSIVRDGDQWFALLVYEREGPDPQPRTEPRIGIDRGVTYTLATSDGRLVENPKHYEKAMKRLAHAQRVVSRRKKGSKNREKAKLRVMRLHRKVRRQREHFLHVESARLAKSHGVVVIEKLNVRGMSRGWAARSIAGAGWAAFAAMLRYKLTETGGLVVEVPAHYSSQTCAVCGTVEAASRNGAAFACHCGHSDHADLNAAKVILSRASRSALPAEGSMPEVAR